MGYPGRRPKYMAAELKQIRETLGLSQSEWLRRWASIFLTPTSASLN